MATNKKGGTGGKAAKAEGGAKAETGGTATMLLPEGFTVEQNPFYAEAVRRRFDTTPPTAVVRVLLMGSKDTTEESVRTLLGNPRYALKMKAPGIWEAALQSKDMEMIVGPNVGAGKTFRWVDLGTRFYGRPVTDAGATVTLAVSAGEGTSDAEAKKKLKALGMTLTATTAAEGMPNPDEGLYVGTMPAANLYDLVLWTKASAIEVR